MDIKTKMRSILYLALISFAFFVLIFSVLSFDMVTRLLLISILVVAAGAMIMAYNIVKEKL